MKYKAIVTDIDGTAIDSPEQKVADERLRGAVRRLDELGVKVCAATGRAETFAAEVFESMGLKDPAIVSGGSRIIDPITKEQLWGCSLDEDQMKHVIEVFSDSDMRFLRNEWTDEEYLGGAHPLEDFVEYEETYIFVACFVQPDDVQGILDRLSAVEGINAIVATSHMSGRRDIHITHEDASKEHAVYELEKLIGVSKSEMIGIGDGANDIHLFDAVGHKVAMSNAVDELKSQADKVIGDVAEDGLAAYFEQLVEGIKAGGLK